MRTSHALLALSVAAVWGVNFVVIHVGLEHFPPLMFGALRFTLIALPAVFLIRRPDIPWKLVAGVGLFMSAGQFGLLFVAMNMGLPAGLASLVLQLQAVFTIGLAIALLHEKPSTGQLLGATTAVGGIAIIAVGRAEGVPLVGVLLCVGAAASWGVGNVIARIARPKEPVALLVWSSLVPPIPLALLSLGFEGSASWASAFESLGATGLLALLYVVVVSTFFGFGVWAWLLGKYPASTVAPFTLLVPVVGIGTAWVALGEQPNAAEIAGAGVVLMGLALTVGVMRLRRRPAPIPAARTADEGLDAVDVGLGGTAPRGVL